MENYTFYDFRKDTRQPKRPRETKKDPPAYLMFCPVIEKSLNKTSNVGGLTSLSSSFIRSS